MVAFTKNGRVWMTREEIIEIELYCSEYKVSRKARLTKRGIPFWNFYRTRMKYQQEDERSETGVSAGNFIQLSASPLGLEMQSSKQTGRKRSQKDAGPIVESYLTIESWTATGTGSTTVR